MAVYSLLAKDLREHRTAALVLGVACLVVVLLLLEQNAVAAYSMSAFEIVRFSLIGFLPLIALIVGNRLIVREYLSGTRLFVEALPIGNVVPLLLKYLLGLTYIAIIAAAMVLLAGQRSGIADDVTGDYVLLILAKTLVMVSLYWSLVFCFSLCGYLRIALYLMTIGIISVLAFYPGLDASGFAPMALMDSQLFVYERDTIPWQQMGLTLLMSLALTLAGFLLTRIGEGSVIERLAKPMTRRDYVALGVLAVSGLALASALMDDNQREPIDFSSLKVVRLEDPDVSVMYLNDQYQQSASELAERLADSLAQLQSTLALPGLPTVRLVLSPTREKHDIDYSTDDGVFIAANWLEHDSYDNAILDAVIMHGVMSAQTGGRAVFEPYHWVLDGFTRWWVEQGVRTLDQGHKDELVARAMLTLEREPRSSQLIERWQLTADRFSYPSAEALAWAAVSYLEELKGRDAVILLATEFLTQTFSNTSFVSLQDRTTRVMTRLEPIIGMSLDDFHQGWQQWLRQQANSPGVIELLNSVPAVSGRVTTQIDSAGVRSIQAGYEALQPDAATDLNAALEALGGVCVLKHGYIGPFDTEYNVPDDEKDSGPCQVDTVVHTLSSIYASGDRVFIALDYEGERFHQPIRLHVQRLYIP